MKIGILCSQFNSDLVKVMYEDALQVFKKNNFKTETFFVPGAGEIPQASKWVLESQSSWDGLLALGVIVQGETSHYDFLVRLIEKSLWDLQKSYSLPLVFSILMVESKLQAKQRIVDKKRGQADAQVLIDMIELKNKL